MKKFLMIAVALISMCFASQAMTAAPKQQKQVVLQTNLHCKNCAAKIVDNVAFEKGVKDMSTSVDDKTVTIIYDPAKTDAKKLAEAVKKLGYSAEIVSDTVYNPTKKK